MDNLSAKFLKLHKKTVYKDYSMFGSDNGRRSKVTKKWDGIEIKINELSNENLQKWFSLFQEYLKRQSELRNLNIPNYYYKNFFLGFRTIILESKTLVDYGHKINESKFTFDVKENIISNIVNNFSNDCLLEINDLKDELKNKSNKVYIGVYAPELYNRTKENIKQLVTDEKLIPVFFTEEENNTINYTRIYEELNNCDFGIFDISLDNSNIAFAAGYMAAKGKELLLVCDESCLENIKFGFNKKSIILFSNQDELREKILNKLTSIIKKI